jgi:hypothetical protein
MYVQLEKIKEWLYILIDLLLSIIMGPYALVITITLKIQPLIEPILTRRYTDFRKGQSKCGTASHFRGIEQFLASFT